MKKDRPEGPADIGEPSEEGAKVLPDEDPRRRNMSGRFPGEANEKKRDKQELESGGQAKRHAPTGSNTERTSALPISVKLFEEPSP